MEKKVLRSTRKAGMVCAAALLLLFLSASVLFIVKEFVGLNASVEYERSVFISQIAQQMKNNVTTSRKNNLEVSRTVAQVLSEIQPRSFEEVGRLFPDYDGTAGVNQLFLLSAECELYELGGVKQWVSLPYDSYFLDALAQPHTSDFIRIGTNREFMVYSALLPAPVHLNGHEIAAVLYGWDSTEYRSTLSSRLFEEKSSSLLVGGDGNIAVYPEEEDNETYGYNIFTYLTKQGMRGADLETIQKLIAGTEDTTVLCEVKGSRWLFSISYYSEQYRILIMLPIQITSAGTYRSLYGLIAGVVAALLTLFLAMVAVLLWMVRRQRAQREKELQTELLMKTAQAKNAFLAKMSHDIRTPLNGIIGMNYLAASKLPPACTETAACLKKVDVSAKYLLGILNDILDMSKIESGKLELRAAPFSLEELADGIEPLIQAQLEKKNVRFLLEMPPTNSAYLGDELRIKQILMNLLSNAVKFTAEGTVTLEVSVRPLEDGKDVVTFTVRDTGKGMNPEFQKNLFSPFVQEDSGIAARYGGSGLGLSIARSYAELMGGTITVASQPGKGSEFAVSLPLEKTVLPPRAAQTAPAREAAVDFSGRRVLLCEDNDLNAEIAGEILAEFGLKVDRASNGKEGVALFEQSAPGMYDLIFMDVRMPEMDGCEATRAIRALVRPDAKKVPVCALSANAFVEDIQQSFAAGMNEHLAKPLEISRLVAVLKKYLN